MLNNEVFQKIKQVRKHILVVTKYWDKEKTLKIIQECKTYFSEVCYGFGENRIENLKEKNLPRENIHFIGNIQSRKIPEIAQYCSTIHSLSNLKHAQKIEAQQIKIEAFIQIQLDKTKGIGIQGSQLKDFLDACKNFKYLKIIGISGMGNGFFSQEEKRNEFQKLVSLRDTFIPSGIISAGTSRDYEIALEEGIDVVRIGQASVQ